MRFCLKDPKKRQNLFFYIPILIAHNPNVFVDRELAGEKFVHGRYWKSTRKRIPVVSVFGPHTMDQKLAELEAKNRALQEEQKRLREEMDEIKVKMLNERMTTLNSDERAFYERKLRRVKAYVEAFVAETAYESRGALIENRKMNLKYGFRYHELPYTDDAYEAMNDPLDWAIMEYDLLGMSEHLDIRFDYHSEFLKDFVMKWMLENMPHVEYDERMFAFRR